MENKFWSNFLKWSLWVGLLIFYTILFLNNRLESVYYVFLVCFNALFLFVLLGFSRLKELDIRNLKLILTDIKKTRDEIFAKEQDLSRVAQYLLDFTGFMSISLGRMSSAESHKLRQDWIKSKLIELQRHLNLSVENISPYQKLYEKIDENLPDVSKVSSPRHEEAKARHETMCAKLDSLMKEDVEKLKNI